MTEHFADPVGVLIADPTGFAKIGRHQPVQLADRRPVTKHPLEDRLIGIIR